MWRQVNTFIAEFACFDCYIMKYMKNIFVSIVFTSFIIF